MSKVPPETICALPQTKQTTCVQFRHIQNHPIHLIRQSNRYFRIYTPAQLYSEFDLP